MKLKQQHLLIVKTLLKDWVPDFEVWAFGSRITEQVKPYSDLDLLILDQKPIDLTLLAQLKNAFSESNLPFKVDLTIWSGLTPSFREIIQARHQVIQRPERST